MPFNNPDVIEIQDGQSVFNITDLEGRWELLERAIECFNDGKSDEQKILVTTIDGKEQLIIPDNIKIIFGGDACDKGPSDLRLRALFVNTKKNYIAQEQPDKLTLIGGNRDYNLVRYYKELHVDRILETLEANIRPEWVQDKFRVTFGMYALQNILSTKPVPESLKSYVKDFEGLKDDKQKLEFVKQVFAKSNAVQKTQLLRHINEHLKTIDPDALKFMYLEWSNIHTMGRVETVECRRQELWCQRNDVQPHLITKEQKEQAKKEITNKEVLDSVMDFPSIKEYLELTQVAAKVGNEQAGYKNFVHGGVSKDALTIGGETYDNLDKWVVGINAIAQKEIAEIYAQDYAKVKNPNGKLLYSELERIALPNGLTGQVGDLRKGTPVSFECWKQVEVKLDNGETVKQLVHYLDPSVLDMAEKSNVSGFGTGHKPTANSELGTVYTTTTTDGKLFTLTTTDVTFGFHENGKETCSAVYTWNKDKVDIAMTSYSNKLQEYVTARLPTSSADLRTGTTVGSIVYVPEPGKTNTNAWNVIVLDKDDNGNYNKMILQRIEGYSAFQIVKTDAKEIKDLLSANLPLEHKDKPMLFAAIKDFRKDSLKDVKNLELEQKQESELLETKRKPSISD